jgi:hypothetical protein
MKHILLIMFLTMTLSASAQTNIPEYKASNGITYHAGDTVKLGRGSHPTGSFNYIQVMGITANTQNAEANNLPRDYSSGNAIVKKVASWKRKGATKIYLVVGVGMATNYWISTEDAIATGEIAK